MVLKPKDLLNPNRRMYLFVFLSKFHLMKNWILIVVCALGLGHFASASSQRKVIQTQEFKEVCYVTSQEITPDINTVYFWYKSNEIFHSKGDYLGELLDGEYSKQLYTNQLIEKGFYARGVKTGTWKKWHANGKLKEISQWKEGKLDGAFYSFDANGKLIFKGKYRKGLKKGLWVEAKDTLNYKKGIVVLAKAKKEKKAKDTKVTTKTEENKASKKVKKTKKEKKAFAKETKDKTIVKGNSLKTRKTKSTKSKTKKSKEASKKKTEAKKSEKNNSIFRRILNKKEEQ